MARYQNRIVTNRKSPSNENAYRQAYSEMNPSARKRDHYDIPVVGITGSVGKTSVKDLIYSVL